VDCLKFDDAEFVSNTPSRVPKWGGGSVGHSIGLSRLILCISDATGTVFLVQTLNRHIGRSIGSVCGETIT
jgi:hypothetical protein